MLAEQRDAQQLLLLPGVTARDQLQQAARVVQHDAVVSGEAACLGGVARARYELAAGDAVHDHDAPQLGHEFDSHFPARPVLAPDDADGRAALAFRVQPDVDTAAAAARLRARLETGLAEEKLDHGFEAPPFDEVEDFGTPHLGRVRARRRLAWFGGRADRDGPRGPPPGPLLRLAKRALADEGPARAALADLQPRGRPRRSLSPRHVRLSCSRSTC
jgi:hypothetical protein